MKIQKFQNSGEITNGTIQIGSKSNNRRVGQKSLLGERKPKNYWDMSFAERALNNITDFLHITSPPTYKDGYDRVLNAEVPLKESAHGQELKRMGETAKNAGEIALTGFTMGSFPALLKAAYARPLEIVGSTALGGAGTIAGRKVGEWADNKLESQGYSFKVPAKKVLSRAGGLAGSTAGWMYGNGVTKRAIEAAMHGSGGASYMSSSIKDFVRFEPKTEIGKKIMSKLWPKNIPIDIPKELKRDVYKYIFFNKQNKTNTANTISFTNFDFGTKYPFAKQIGETPYYAKYYDGIHGAEFSGMPVEGADLVSASVYDKPLSILKETKSDVFDDYIREKYPMRAWKIKTYTSPVESGVTPFGKITSKSAEGSIEIPGIATIDAGGHRHLFGETVDGQPIHKFTDIWKFNPRDYVDKYGNMSWLDRYGLRVVDSHTTPVITDTGWMIGSGVERASSIPSSNIKIPVQSAGSGKSPGNIFEKIDENSDLAKLNALKVKVFDPDLSHNDIIW